jgi:2'-5' RNA ligase
MSMSADTARLASQHNRIGKPGGPGLFHDKSLQLPAYIQNIAKALMRQGKPKSQAIQIAIGTVKKWAAGGGGVSPEVKAAAAKALAEWEAAKAKARATPNKGAKLSNPFDLANSAADVTPRMGMVALEVPAGTIAPLKGGTAADDMHITLAFLGDDVDDKTLARAIALAYDASHRRPLSGTVGGLGTFPPKEDGAKVPVWCPVNVPGVNDMASNFRSLSASGMGYVPHITLAFVPEGSKLPDPVPPTPVTLTNLIVKRGDQVFRFPLGEGYDDSPRAESAFSRLRSRAIELATKAKKKAPAKPAKGDAQSAKFGEPDLPKGATGWKHGWIPVDSSGKPVGPAQKPAWLIADEKKHLAAGGKTAAEQRAISGAKELAAPKKAAAAKAKAAAKHKAALERQAANKAKSAKAHEAAAAKHAATAKTRAEKKAESEKTAKQKAKERQIQAAYKQAEADLKAGRKLTPQQQRVVAYVDAQNAKQTAANRKVDVAGQKVTAPKTLAVKKAAARKVAKKTAVKPKVVTKTVVVRARSYKSSSSRPTALANEPDVNALDFSASHPRGQLAFRYKHNWILINPAIPSRGRMGGGLAVQHGHKSGTVTHGHFEPHPSGKGKVFVADRHGGKLAAQKLAELHAGKSAPHLVGGKINYTKPEKSKYKLAAVNKAPKGNALKPATPSAEAVKAKSAEANTASATANKTKSVADAQVAAKKHADAFVQAKKAGDTQLAESHKKNAQAWAKKANDLKKADAASKQAKAKYEAEQKSKAADEKAAAEKAQAEQKAAAEKAKKADEAKDAALKLYAHFHDQGDMTSAAAIKSTALSPNTNNSAKLSDFDAIDKKKAAEKDAAAKAEHKQKSNEANALGSEAFAQTMDANDIGTAEAHKEAQAAHIKAGDAFKELGQTGDQTMHYDAAAKHEKKAAALAPKKKAVKKTVAEKSSVSPGIAKSNEKMATSDAVGEVIDNDLGDAPGALGQWDDYLHASAAYKKNPTPANLKKLSTMQKALTEAGVEPSTLTAVNKSLYQKLGISSPAKKTAAKKTVTKITASGKKEVTKITADVPDISLPGPGMYKDGLAIKAAQEKYDNMSASPEKTALGKAITNAKVKFKDKHGVNYTAKKAGAEAGTSKPFVPHGDHIKEHKSYAAAKKDGYEPVGNSESANGDWKPSKVPGLKSTAGGYHYSGGAYKDINQQLRKYKSPTGGSNDAAIAQMDKEFAAVPPLDHGIVTTRKMSGGGPFPGSPPPMEPGAVFKDWGYSSTSKDPDVWSGDVIMTVKIPKGTKVLDLNHTTGSQHSTESEILLDRGTHYKIESDKTVGGTRKIIVIVVPGPKD